MFDGFQEIRSLAKLRIENRKILTQVVPLPFEAYHPLRGFRNRWRTVCVDRSTRQCFAKSFDLLFEIFSLRSKVYEGLVFERFFQRSFGPSVGYISQRPVARPFDSPTIPQHFIVYLFSGDLCAFFQLCFSLSSPKLCNAGVQRFHSTEQIFNSDFGNLKLTVTRDL